MADEKDSLSDAIGDEESIFPECLNCGSPHDPGDTTCVMCGIKLAAGRDPYAESARIRQATRNMLILLVIIGAGVALRGCDFW